MLRISCVFIGLVLSVASAIAAEKNAPVLPDDVNVLIQRIQACHQWAGEESSNPVRVQEIAEALKKWRCDAIEIDQKATIKRYASNAKITDQIKEAIDTY